MPRSNGSMGLIAVALLLALSLPAVAKEKSKKRKARKKSPPAAAPATPTEAEAEEVGAALASSGGASAARRAKGGFGAAAKYGSPGVGFLSFGAGLDKTFTETWQAAGLVFYANQELPTQVREVTGDGFKITTDKAAIKMIAAGAASRYFIGNSFFISGGLIVRSIDADFQLSVYNTNPAQRTGGFTANVQAQSLLLTAFAGNQWSFDNGLYVTGEWLGYGLPVIYTHAYKQEATGLLAGKEAALDEVASIQDSLGKKLSTAGSLGLVVSLGWMF